MKIGLVLEGGANRGVFTSGVLDYFMEQDLGKAFRYVIGTSAGAGNAMNFISGQHGRSRDTTITKDKRYAYFGLKISFGQGICSTWKISTGGCPQNIISLISMRISETP